MSRNTTSGTSVKAFAGWLAATALVATVGVVAEGFLAAGSIVLALFLGTVALGVAVAAVVAAATTWRETAGGPGLAWMSGSGRCSGCGSVMAEFTAVRICGTCDRIAA